MNQFSIDTPNRAIPHFAYRTTFAWANGALVEVTNAQPLKGEPCMDVEVRVHTQVRDACGALVNAAILNLQIVPPYASTEFESDKRAAHWYAVIDATSDVKALMNFSRQDRYGLIEIEAKEIVTAGVANERSEHAIRRNAWLARALL